MNPHEIHSCPCTLSPGYQGYSRTALKQLFHGKRVRHVLPYDLPDLNDSTRNLFEENRQRISISGVQDKFSLVLDKNTLRLADEGEQGQYVLKPIPSTGKNPDQMPANEHLTMQIARQVFKIQTAENALIFFRNGTPAYLTKRFDVHPDGSKKAQEDFASLAGLLPQKDGEHFKYKGNYLTMFELLRKFVPAYASEAPKLYKLLVFNYLFSNGDAHYKNFSIIETSMGDFILSPAYDLLNTRIHILDTDFALEDGLLPPSYSRGTVRDKFMLLAEMASIPPVQTTRILNHLTSGTEKVIELIQRSWLSDGIKRNYEQAYRTRLRKLTKNQ
jgi:serine/threonine-protein kinase HipA